MSDTEIRVGDRVRLSYNGIVRSSENGVVQLQETFDRYYLSTANIEILERGKPKVGDALPVGQVGELPAGALIVGTVSGERWFKSDNGWVAQQRSAFDIGKTAGTYRILYLPA